MLIVVSKSVLDKLKRKGESTLYATQENQYDLQAQLPSESHHRREGGLQAALKLGQLESFSLTN